MQSQNQGTEPEQTFTCPSWDMQVGSRCILRQSDGDWLECYASEADGWLFGPEISLELEKESIWEELLAGREDMLSEKNH